MRTKSIHAVLALAISLTLLACPVPVAPPTNNTITLSAIPGLTAPARGASPVTTITETAQYTGTVSWSPAVSGTFAAGTAYTATITLAAKPGYTLSGVGANFFTVAGATSVSNGANSGVVTAVFPATAYAVGDSGPAGGIIFYDKGSYSEGWRYLEAWTADETGGYQWKTSDTYTDGIETAIGTGHANTYSAMAGSEHPAAIAARDATHGGYGDWFLPSYYELSSMYEQRGIIGGFETGEYWSSSQYSGNSGSYLSAEAGILHYLYKSYSLKVRVARMF